MKYEGEFLEGLFSGQGTLTTKLEGKVNSYKGAFINGKKTLKGKLVEFDTTTYEGDWEDDR